MPSFKVVIPARYGSQRLPGKPLMDIAGKPMVQHVYERACESGAEQVVIATDDERIRRICANFTEHACMTSTDHQSGTDRIAEVADAFGWDADTVVVNLQGDEPLMPPELLTQVAGCLVSHTDADMATLAVPIDQTDQLFDTNAVKVVCDRDGYALYFSRATIPWRRDVFAKDQSPQPDWLDGLLRHLGIYAYRAGFLSGYSRLERSPVEQMESLEQLRVLWNGGKIAVEVADGAPPAGVDTAHDLRRVVAALS